MSKYYAGAPQMKFHGFLVANRASIWISFMILVIASTMMHPAFASLIAISIIAVLLVVMRWVAHIEGRHQS